MTPALITAIAAIAAALGVAAIAGVLHNRRSGVLRDTTTPTAVDTSDLGLSRTGPTIVHFSAVWCGPCAGVRRVVDPGLRRPARGRPHRDRHGRQSGCGPNLSVLSLPTTFIFDADGNQRYRTSGVPKAADLRSALEPLLA